MKLIYTLLTTVFLISCSASKEIKEQKDFFTGYWVLEDYTIKPERRYKTEDSFEIDKHCFKDSYFTFFPVKRGTHDLEMEKHEGFEEFENNEEEKIEKKEQKMQIGEFKVNINCMRKPTIFLWQISNENHKNYLTLKFDPENEYSPAYDPGYKFEIIQKDSLNITLHNKSIKKDSKEEKFYHFKKHRDI